MAVAFDQLDRRATQRRVGVARRDWRTDWATWTQKWTGPMLRRCCGSSLCSHCLMNTIFFEGNYEESKILTYCQHDLAIITKNFNHVAYSTIATDSINLKKEN